MKIQVKEKIEDQIFIQEDPKSTRESLRSTKYPKEKERGSTIYTRDCEKEKQDHSKREIFKPIVQPWSRDLSKPSRSLQSSSSSSQAFIQLFIHLEEIQKGDSSFE